MRIRLLRQLVAGVRAIVVLTVLLGVVYPLLIWGIGQAAFPDRANGSLVTRDGAVVGSALIGQAFEGDQWFQLRPSASGYDGLASGASNLGPSSPELLRTIEQRRLQIAAREGVAPAAVPPEAVTASGSGLDPAISPEYAELQVARVARANGLTSDQVQDLVRSHTKGRALGFLGESTVNVLELNLAVAAAD